MRTNRQSDGAGVRQIRLRYVSPLAVASFCVSILAGCGVLAGSVQERMPTDSEFTNSIAMKLVRIEPGSFMMGQQQGGDFDEQPVHKVNITRPFYMSAAEVTNAQYEQFDPSHRHLRGRSGFSRDGDEAVIFVSWDDATAFCKWLSEKHGRPYRLPTEAEWEYACRAGTTTDYYTGGTWPEQFRKNQQRPREPKPVGLHVGRTTANAWGLYDMHGNVEEWCTDWYGPYKAAEQTNPIGPAGGDFRVTRGGSHNTQLRYLRSANRMGTLPEDRHWLIGFRVVMGQLPNTRPTAVPGPELWGRQVAQGKYDWSRRSNTDGPYFIGPKKYVKVPPGSNGPMFSKHNHDPGFTWCDNGDLLAIWYSCRSERGRELCVVASRLRRGAKEWEPAAPFWDAPDRNDHAPALLNDGEGRLYHFNGLSAASSYRKNLALVMRTSADNGATWSSGKLINAVRGIPSQPIASTSVTQDGCLFVPVDWPWHPDGAATGLWMSGNRGLTWEMAKGRVAGIHAGVAEAKDGRLIALGRRCEIDGRMPMSVSADAGRTWTYKASIFPPIGGGQRLVLIRLREGPLFVASFGKEMTLVDADGNSQKASGLFGAVSYDQGQSWAVRRLITDGRPAHVVEAMDRRQFTMSPTSAEPAGYLAGMQSPDGVIHLISSKQYYGFNLAWLKDSRGVLKW